MRKLNLPGLRKIFALLTPYRGRFALAVFFLLVGATPSLLYPQATKWAIDQVSASADQSDGMQAINTMALFVLALALIQSVFIWVRHYLMSWLGERVVADLRQRVFHKLMTFEPLWYHEQSSGEIVSRLSSDVTKIEGVLGSQLSMALRQSVVFVGALVLLIWQSPSLTLWMLLIVPPLVLGTLFFGRFIRKISKFVQDRLADTNAHLEEVVSGIETVQAFTRESRERARYDGNVNAVFGAGLRLAKWRATFMSTSSLLGFTGLGIILWLGGRHVVDGTMSPGDLVAFMMYTTTVAGSVATLASVWSSIQGAIGATERVFAILDESPRIEAPLHGKILADVPVHIEFKNVQYAYPSRPKDLVLNDISLKVPAGQTIAVVGESGAGKSTLAGLLLRFYDPQVGGVSMNDVPIDTLDLPSMRSKIAVVSQEPVLFSGSIFDNIAYAKPEAQKEEVSNAARHASAHDFIQSFELGYDTEVGERGVQLSVGQKQRIAIARAILAEPKVLILDEATSNLDAASEAAVQKALDSLMQDRTTLVVAHRLSTVKNANRIIVMRQGKIVESGSHDELMQDDSYYRHLVEHQLVKSTAA